MLFDRPAALPVARALGASSATLASQARGGLLWLRPRMVPILVALAGMFAVLGSAEYLSRLARQTPTVSQAHTNVVEAPAHLIVVPGVP